jgi:hypothetical protein
MEVTNMYVIKTRKLATYLIDKGFELVKQDKNRLDPRYDVFLFNDTPVLRAVVEQYKNQNKSSI